MRRLAAARAVLHRADVRRAVAVAAVAGVGLAGWVLGLLLGASAPAMIGPFDTTMRARPALDGGTRIALPPLGSLSLETHSGPVALEVTVDEVDVAGARRLLEVTPEAAERGIVDDLRAGVVRLALRALAVSVLAALLAGAVVFRDRLRALLAGAVALVLSLGSGAVATATFDPRAVGEPTYTGLLAAAPRAVGDAQDVIDRFAHYRGQLRRMVSNVAELYRTLETLPAYRPGGDVVRLLHVSDLHLNPAAFDVVRRVVPAFAVDLVVDTGDLTDFGTGSEARYVANIGTVPVPYVYVRGNHDSVAVQRAVAAQPNAVVLDGGTVREVAGLRLVGFGDPRFTPDKSEFDDKEVERETIERFAPRVADALSGLREPPDVLAVHDPRAAADAVGLVPLVLAGHRHRATTRYEDGTVVLVEGSTGGAGLRGLEGEQPTPLSLSVVYLDAETGRAQALDRITVAGLGLSSVRITRELLEPAPEASPSPSP